MANNTAASNRGMAVPAMDFGWPETTGETPMPRKLLSLFERHALFCATVRPYHFHCRLFFFILLAGTKRMEAS